MFLSRSREKDGTFFLRSATWTYKQREMRTAMARRVRGPGKDIPPPGLRQPLTLKDQTDPRLFAMNPPEAGCTALWIANDTGFLYTVFDARGAAERAVRVTKSSIRFGGETAT